MISRLCNGFGNMLQRVRHCRIYYYYYYYYVSFRHMWPTISSACCKCKPATQLKRATDGRTDGQTDRRTT